MEKKRCTAIVLAAGSGSRMKSSVAKQFMQLCGKPLIWYALHTIEESSVIDDCILVTGAEDISYVKGEIVDYYGFHKVDSIVSGGRERYDSVYQALRVIAEGRLKTPNKDGCVFIHDGARPFLTEEILQRCYEEVQKSKACVAGMPVKDTIKIADRENFSAQTPDRTLVWQIQTPQVFESLLIIEAYEKLMRKKDELISKGIKITDDAMVVETFADTPVKLVQASYENIKITTPEDMLIAKAFIGKNR